MTYSESAKGITITYQRALAEVRRHGVPEYHFIAEFGVRTAYVASEVLQWLGY